MTFYGSWNKVPFFNNLKRYINILKKEIYLIEFQVLLFRRIICDTNSLNFIIYNFIHLMK